MSFSVAVDRPLAHPGEVVHWTFTYLNDSGNPATGVSIYCVLPPQTTFGRIAPGTITFPLGSCAVGQIMMTGIDLTVLPLVELNLVDRFLVMEAHQDTDTQNSETRTVSIPLILPSVIDKIKLDMAALLSEVQVLLGRLPHP